MEAFQLRLWDGRIGRWLNPDPYGQNYSPYMGMGNNPISMIDPDGGNCTDANGNSVPCGDMNSAYKNSSTDIAQLNEVVIQGKPKSYSLGDLEYDFYKYGNKFDILADKFGQGFGQLIGSLHPGVGLLNAYKGFTEGHDMFGNEMGKGGATFEGAMAVVPFIKIGKLLPEGKYILHHIASNKHLSKFTPQYEAIASKLGLKLDAAWNKILITDVRHYSRHPKQYHQFVLEGMQAAEAGAEGNVTKFLELYDEYVIQPLIKNPDIVNKTGWK